MRPRCARYDAPVLQESQADFSSERTFMKIPAGCLPFGGLTLGLREFGENVTSFQFIKQYSPFENICDLQKMEFNVSMFIFLTTRYLNTS